jgi:hypothetical protein
VAGDKIAPVDAPPRLTDAQRRKLLLWRRLVTWSMAGAGLFALVEIALFLCPQAWPQVWPGSIHAARMTVGGILIEFVGSAAILGAAGKCPACGAGFGMEHKGLVPARCRRCGVGLA